MGLLAAVRQWYKRDHAAEQHMWLGWMRGIEKRLKPLPSTSFEYLEPEDLSNKATQLRVKWDAQCAEDHRPRTGGEAGCGTPAHPDQCRVGAPPRPDGEFGDHHAVTCWIPARRTSSPKPCMRALTRPGPYPDPVVPSGGPAAIAGDWTVTVQYLRGEGTQKIHHPPGRRACVRRAHWRALQGRSAWAGARRPGRTAQRDGGAGQSHTLDLHRQRSGAMPCRARPTWGNMVLPAGRGHAHRDGFLSPRWRC